MKEKTFSVPNRLRLLVRPNIISDIRECSSAMCEAGTPTRASIWHTASGNTEGNLLASRIEMRTGRRDRSLMKIRAWRRPIRSVLPYQSPSRVVDSTGGRSSTFFNRARSCRVQRSTITLMSVLRNLRLIVGGARNLPECHGAGTSHHRSLCQNGGGTWSRSQRRARCPATSIRHSARLQRRFENNLWASHPHGTLRSRSRHRPGYPCLMPSWLNCP